MLSTKKLAEIVKKNREEKNLTQEKLGCETGINRIMIGRIEKDSFVPSISQLEALANVLDFDIIDLFIENERKNSFVALRGEAITQKEKEGLEKLFTLILTLRQQIYLRHKLACK